jgi:hypothetical protein
MGNDMMVCRDNHRDSDGMVTTDTIVKDSGTVMRARGYMAERAGTGIL